MIELDRLELPVSSGYSSGDLSQLKLAVSYSLTQKRRRRRRQWLLLLLLDHCNFASLTSTTTTASEQGLHLSASSSSSSRATTRSLPFHFRLPLIISLLLKLSLLFLLVSDLPPSIWCLSHKQQQQQVGGGFDFGDDVNESQARLRKSLPNLPRIMEQTGSIFGSLLGGSSSSNSNNNNGNSAAQQQQQQQQLLMQQQLQQAADLHQSYKNGQLSDKVTLPGDILLGGLFPIHMKGKWRNQTKTKQNKAAGGFVLQSL